jgi:hypothetical protein
MVLTSFDAFSRGHVRAALQIDPYSFRRQGGSGWYAHDNSIDASGPSGLHDESIALRRFGADGAALQLGQNQLIKLHQPRGALAVGVKVQQLLLEL